MGSDSRVLVHATSVALGSAREAFGGPPEAAVLLTGSPGAGKSDVALRLIAMGAKLVSDDQTELFAERMRLIAAAPPSLHGLLEIRGVGIVRITPAPPSPLVLVVRLDGHNRVERLPEASSWELPKGLGECKPLPLISLNPFEISTPAKIAAAAGAIAQGRFVAGAASSESGPFL